MVEDADILLEETDDLLKEKSESYEKEQTEDVYQGVKVSRKMYLK